MHWATMSSVPVLRPCSGLVGPNTTVRVCSPKSWTQVPELHSLVGSTGQQKAQVLPRAAADIQNKCQQ